MRIEKIVLKNYRQFKNTVILLNKKNSDNDLHIFIGDNGTGKTNLLNAINWCLYGDEPHLSKNSQLLPILNIKSIEETEDGKDQEIIVEIWLKSENNEIIIFTKKAVYKIKDRKFPSHTRTKFEVKFTDNKGNTKILEDEKTEPFVNGFVPKKIREFFFFDGERLDKYFLESTRQNIHNAVFNISQIDLLSEVETKLNNVIKEFRNKAGKLNPEIEKVANDLEEKESNLKKLEKQIEEHDIQSGTAKEKAEEYRKKLMGLPDISALEKEKERLKKSKGEKESFLKDKKKDKQNLLFEYGKIINLYPIINRTIKIIEEKRENKEIPPTIDKHLLRDILEKNFCSICKRPLDNGARKSVDSLLNDIKLSSDIAQQLLNMEYPLREFKDKIKNFKKKLEKNHEIENYEKDLADIEKRIKDIDNDIRGYDSVKIKDWHTELKNFEDIFESKQQTLGALKAERERSIEEIKKIKEKLDREIESEKKCKKLEKQIKFCKKALRVTEETKEVILREIRERIESKTKKLFFELVWKKETFKDIKIEEDYNINLIHSMGYECLGSTGAAERELLALSFTLALHDISGFASPILIDTPVARIGGENRENFGKVLSEVSRHKQIILIFHPDEYTENINQLLDKKSNNIFRLKLSSDEKEVNVEV